MNEDIQADRPRRPLLPSNLDGDGNVLLKNPRRGVPLLVPLALVMLVICGGLLGAGGIYWLLKRDTVFTISEHTIPFSKQVVMLEGDAYRFQLPNGKEVAVWCEKPMFPPNSEQSTASGLKARWGERPFRDTPVVREDDSEGEKAKTYIRFWGVSTNTNTRRSESRLFVDDWQVSIISDLSAPNNLPVTVEVTVRTSRQK